jgi:hypothetical protein
MGTNLMEASEQWARRPADERFETLAGLAESVRSRRMRSRSLDIARNDIVAETLGEKGIVINSNISPCAPTHWAFGQLCQASRMNGVAAPASYLRQLPNELAVKCLNEGLRNGERESHKFMTISRADETDGPATLQAVTSTTYGRIWDADVVSAVERIVQRTDNRFYNPRAIVNGEPRGSGLYASDHDIFAFLIDGGSVLDAGPRSQLNRGFIVLNSETGARTFGLMTFLFNHVCGNHIIWGANDVNKLVIRHTRGGPYRFDAEAAPALLAYTESSAAPILATIQRAQARVMWDGHELSFAGLMNELNRTSKFSRSEITEAIRLAKAEEGDARTLWQIVQGFTAYARGYDWIDARVDLEKRAGALLNLVAG